MSKKKFNADEWLPWLNNNKSWLSEWLANVVVIKEVDAEKSDAVFQTFRTYLPGDTLGGVLTANNEMNYLLIQASVLGIHSEGIMHPSGKGWTNPPMFSGFLQRNGRMPMDGDVAVYTATKWHKFELWQPSPIMVVGDSITGGFKPVLTTVCSVDFVTGKVAKS